MLSAWTSAILYRPGPPPIITPGSLADFIEQLIALDVLDDNTRLHAMLKFGKSIDQDDKDTVIEDNPGAIVTVVRTIKWDAEIETQSPTDLLQWLHSPFKTKGLFTRQLVDPIIYRALIGLGDLREAVYSEFLREEDEENDIGGLWFSEFFISIAPEVVADPQGDGTSYMVGWMSVSASGQCYLWPWTYKETLALIKASEPMQRIRDLCRSFWPVPPIELKPEHIELRKSMGHLWGGDDYDAPPDWRWVINESY